MNSEDKGLTAYRNGDYAAALQEWQPLAEAGDAQACHNLAILYSNGEGVAQDSVQAKYWCEQSAKSGNINAVTHLGFLSAQEGDFVQAAACWQRAAEAGEAEAQNQLGLLYHTGNGVAHDNDTAADWFEAAALQNHAEAQYNLGVLYANGRQYSHARHWWQKAAAQNDENARNALQRLDEMGV